jgi:HEAT repeat protein
VIRSTHDSAAGARRASAAGLAAAVLACAAPAVAHDPEPGKPPRARSAPPPAVQGAAALRPTKVDPATGVIAATGAEPLRVLAADAVVFAATVVRTESYDEDRLRVHRLKVERLLRGRLDETAPGLVDMRGAVQRPPLVTDGERVVVIVRPAPDLSYLRQHLPAGPYVVPVSGRDGVVPVTADGDVDAVEAAIEARTPATRRRLAFAGLASGRPRLAADGLLELRLLEGLTPLSATERELVGRTLRDTHVPAVTRVGVLDLLAERTAREALPEVLHAETDTPAVLDAVLAARARLGAPAGRKDLASYLDSTDPGVRAAALRALAALDDPDALGDLDRHATTDKDIAVRVAAIDALGATKRADVVPVLSKTFASTEREVQQASARAMIAVGGPVVDDALIQLALAGSTPETKSYAALVLVTMHGRDSPAVRRLEAGNPGPEVTELLQHGLEFRHTHVH